VADQLGVSRTTVSNAYNRPEQLSDALRQRILTTAADIGYHGPSPAARTLRTGRHGAIGVVFTEELRFVFSDPDTTCFLQGVAEACSSSATGVVLLPAPAGLALDQTAIPSAAVDGFIIFSAPDHHPAIQSILRRAVPTLIVDEPAPEPGHAFIGIDDRDGARQLASYLHGLGHREVAVVTLPMTVERNEPGGQRTIEQAIASPVRVVRERLQGIIDAGITPLVWEADASDPDAGRRLGRRLLTAHRNTTAVMALSDQLAIGVTQAAWQLGIRVPQDLSVTGFDDIDRAATWGVPITTIAQPLVEKGRVAAADLLDLIRLGLAPQHRTLPIELVVRGSTGPAPTGNTAHI
jgi:DNA-binding LacI/PurR family transcriptional regulator